MSNTDVLAGLCRLYPFPCITTSYQRHAVFTGKAGKFKIAFQLLKSVAGQREFASTAILFTNSRAKKKPRHHLGRRLPGHSSNNATEGAMANLPYQSYERLSLCIIFIHDTGITMFEHKWFAH